jgi:hypothetical protein
MCAACPPKVPSRIRDFPGAKSQIAKNKTPQTPQKRANGTFAKAVGRVYLSPFAVAIRVLPRRLSWLRDT